MSFFPKKQKTGGQIGPVWGTGTSGKREDIGKRCRRVNMVEMLCMKTEK
jgi:hypothetical protein